MSATLNSVSLATYFAPERLHLGFLLKFQKKIQEEVLKRNTSRFTKQNNRNSNRDGFGSLEWKFEENPKKLLDQEKQESQLDWNQGNCYNLFMWMWRISLRIFK
jgi:hypothetical protein